jgi:hypothetical protein
MSHWIAVTIEIIYGVRQWNWQWFTRVWGEFVISILVIIASSSGIHVVVIKIELKHVGTAAILLDLQFCIMTQELSSSSGNPSA